MIMELKPDEIFVFGSNLKGMHTGGAALQAAQDFGAENGIGEGLTGQCYAFPTLGRDLHSRGIKALEFARDRLFATAKALPEKTFLLTKVGTGIAGYPEENMKALFINAPDNIIMPEGWKEK